MDVLTVEEVTAMLVSSAGEVAEGTTRRMEGVGCRAGRIARGLPKDGRDKMSVGVDGWLSVECTACEPSFICRETKRSWVSTMVSLEVNPSETQRWDAPIAVITPSLLMLADLKTLLPSTKLPSFCITALIAPDGPSIVNETQWPPASTKRTLVYSGEVRNTCVDSISPVTSVFVGRVMCCVGSVSSGEMTVYEDAE